MLVVVQLLVLGLYLPPVFKGLPLVPPQTIISLLVQTAVCESRALGALVVLVAVQLLALGLYLPPVFKGLPLVPPQTIISLPTQTTVWNFRATGALVVLVATQLSVPKLYLPPVLKTLMPSGVPPHTIIPLSVQTAV